MPVLVTVNSTHASRPQLPWWRPTWMRLGLSCFGLFVLLGALEVFVRRTVEPPAPLHLRDGIYVSQLGLVNGRDNTPMVQGARLEERKRAGELRVFVFGESSVQGAPWGFAGSPVAMLYDQLHTVFPTRDLTVVNMGRGAAKTIDSYYFLITIARFSPDIIVFYQGGNDVFHADYEVCAAAEHPTLHRAWRWGVEHSRLLWTVRAIGPARMVRLLGRSPSNQNGRPDACRPDPTFRTWTTLLVETAGRMGARVFVTTPVENPLRHTEVDDVRRETDERLDVPGKSEAYRRLLACRITAGCDPVAAWNQAHPTEWDDRARMLARRAVWRDVAAGHRAPVVDLFDDLQANYGGGRFEAMFIEEVHLTLAGYWRLAWLWARALGPVIGGPETPLAASARPPPFDENRYVSTLARHEGSDVACILLGTAAWHLQANLVLVGASLAREAVRLEAPPPGGLARSRAGRLAQVLLGWLRQQLGMAPGLPDALLPALRDFDVAVLADELRRSPGCALAGARLRLPSFEAPPSR